MSEKLKLTNVSGTIPIECVKKNCKKDEYGNYYFDFNYKAICPFRLVPQNKFDVAGLSFKLIIENTEDLKTIYSWGDDSKKFDNSSIKESLSYFNNICKGYENKTNKLVPNIFYEFCEWNNSTKEYALATYAFRNGKYVFDHFSGEKI